MTVCMFVYEWCAFVYVGIYSLHVSTVSVVRTYEGSCQLKICVNEHVCVCASVHPVIFPLSKF